MSQYRIGRVNDEINRQMAVILRNIKDPRVQNCLISVTAVDCKQDLRFCRIYYSVINYDKKLDDKAKDEEVKKALSSASGYIRSELARAINLRLTPELEFVRDISLERGAAVSKVMKTIEAEEKRPAEESDD
ncbi:MAG: 30S ribosome-binding factor RbfA [Clostridiales bacterium]|nr:30S ribosome-binding factor RbfA [Clostridiales bacterium]